MSILRQILILLVLGAAIGGYFYYDRFHSPAAPVAARGQAPVIPVTVATVERRVMKRNIEAVGTTRAVRSVEIVPLASGRIVELDIVPGSKVAKGDVLARLDDDIERADLAEAEASLVEKKQAVERAETLRTNKTVSAATLETARAEMSAAEAAVERARRRLADRTVKAPFDGVVGLTSIDVGARVDDGTVLTTIDDLDTIEIEFAVPETLYGRIEKEMPVEARSAAFGENQFAGAVYSIDSRVDSASRAFKVRARLPNPDRRLPAGMFMFLTVTLDATNASVVPDAAVIAEGAETYVYAVDEATAHRREIKTGQRSAGFVEVLGGLEEGETVVTEGHQRLRDGSKVKILNETAGGAPATSMRDGQAMPGEAG
ncbi:MAG: efflux RND transporter periplasmic adaptor subunit [Flavobacteriaceae bacterium]